ncbi:MAG: protein kinase domain-containing protein [Vicinamibacterales bacterium]
MSRRGYQSPWFPRGSVWAVPPLPVINLFNQFQLCACDATAFGTGAEPNIPRGHARMIRVALQHERGVAVDKATVDPLVGTTVAQYEIVARLGGGGMGVVYAARDTRLGRRVALKFLPPQWSHDENAKQRFIREAQAASATDHPNICTIHDISTAADGQLFIVMAHYEGETLKQRLDRGPVEVDEAIDIAAQVAEGLAKAHAQGVVHRDIKPGNLMLTDDGVKILDFGLAKLADSRLKLTLEGSTLGTVAYMSPEQVRGEEADGRSDVWAVGVVLYEMLTGDVPFKGGYPEAIAHAIKTDPPAPIRAAVPEVSEGLEQLVFRALHKDPNVRHQTARDLARALRRLQGRTLPVDLRTEQLSPLHGLLPAIARTPWWRTRRGWAVAAVFAALLVGAPLWVFSPVARVRVAVAPVVNQTGYAELDPYRLALTQQLIAQLRGSRHVRALSYERLSQIVERFRHGTADVSSRDAMQALATHGGAQVIVVPTLLFENGAWRARVEFRNAVTATSEASYDTPAVVSSLVKEAAYGLLSSLARDVDQHVRRTQPWRGYVADAVRSPFRRSGVLPTQFRTLDAAAAFERGADAYVQQEYAAALASFETAAELDPQNPIPRAWQSRTARVMRLDREMTEAGEAASRLMTARTDPIDRLFVEAVAAEARNDAETAEARYRTLAAAADDDPAGILELAAFQDRLGQRPEAIAAFHDALTLDAGLPRAHLELCRLYNPSELANAREHGQRALNAYRDLGSRAGEGQALWCLADILRFGTAGDVAEARRDADTALAIFQELEYPYNLSRAFNYVALAASAQGRVTEAANLWEASLDAARKVRNQALQPLALMNLGVMHVRLGQRARAVDLYQQSALGFESLGQQQRAAEIRANAAAIRIENGDDPEQGLRDVQNALLVSRTFGNRNFEVLAAKLTAASYRYAGRHADAVRELNRALNLAKERDLRDEVASLTIDIGRSRFDLGEYEDARRLFIDGTMTASGTDQTLARIWLGQTLARLGSFDRARDELMRAETDIAGSADPELAPLLETAMGTVAYESGLLGDARDRFSRAAAFWTDTLPDPASVEARAYLGLVEASERRTDRGRELVVASLEQARKMRRLSLEVLCRVFLARIDLARNKADEAFRALADVPPDDQSRTIGSELRAHVHYWRGQALAARGDHPGAQTEHETARALVGQIRSALTDVDRARFVARPDIRRIIS